MAVDVRLILVLAMPLAAVCLLVLGRRRLVRWAGGLAAAAVGAALLETASLVPGMLRGAVPEAALGLVPLPGVVLRLRLDWVSLPFLLTEMAVTLVAVIYAWGYHRPGAGTPLFYAGLLVFETGMSGTTLADDGALFYTFWELMLVASAALIWAWGDSAPGGPRREAAGLKYVIFTQAGSLLVLVALVILYGATGGDSFVPLRQGLTLSPSVGRVLVVLFLVGFGVKMAVFPLHGWLPDAHTVAPMPVTIMLAAAMLSMGAYGILRFPLSLFAPADLVPFSVPMMAVGMLSAGYGALAALAERDIKRVIAYSSVSQMGYVLFGLGTLTADGVVGGTLHVVYHAIVKALLFAVVGIVVHATRRRRLDELGGLGGALPLTAACAAVGILGIAGVPPLCVFASEWLIFSGGFRTGLLLLVLGALGSTVLTVAYALGFGARVFLGMPRTALEPARPPPAMVVPALLLALLAILAGLVPAPLAAWISRGLTALLGGVG